MDMAVPDALYGLVHWPIYVALCFWRFRLKVSRIGA